VASDLEVTIDDTHELVVGDQGSATKLGERSWKVTE
jgi:hypothetical protein